MAFSLRTAIVQEGGDSRVFQAPYENDFSMTCDFLTDHDGTSRLRTHPAASRPAVRPVHKPGRADGGSAVWSAEIVPTIPDVVCDFFQ